MLSVSSKGAARSTIQGSFRRRSPSPNHFCAEDNRPSLVHVKPPCLSNKRLCVSSNHSGVGCVRLAGGGFGGTNELEDAMASRGWGRTTQHACLFEQKCHNGAVSPRTILKTHDGTAHAQSLEQRLTHALAEKLWRSVSRLKNPRVCKITDRKFDVILAHMLCCYEK